MRKRRKQSACVRDRNREGASRVDALEAVSSGKYDSHEARSSGLVPTFPTSALDLVNE